LYAARLFFFLLGVFLCLWVAGGGGGRHKSPSAQNYKDVMFDPVIGQRDIGGTGD
jgi:hypothetical protein